MIIEETTGKFSVPAPNNVRSFSAVEIIFFENLNPFCFTELVRPSFKQCNHCRTKEDDGEDSLQKASFLLVFFGAFRHKYHLVRPDV